MGLVSARTKGTGCWFALLFIIFWELINLERDIERVIFSDQGKTKLSVRMTFVNSWFVACCVVPLFECFFNIAQRRSLYKWVKIGSNSDSYADRSGCRYWCVESCLYIVRWPFVLGLNAIYLRNNAFKIRVSWRIDGHLVFISRVFNFNHLLINGGFLVWSHEGADFVIGSCYN